MDHYLHNKGHEIIHIHVYVRYIDTANADPPRVNMKMTYVMGPAQQRLNKAAPTPCPQSLYWETATNEQSTGNCSIIYYIRHAILWRRYLAWWSADLVKVASMFDKNRLLW